MARLNTEREKRLTPDRIDRAINAITAKGYEVTADSNSVQFQFKGNTITLFAYTGWHTGKGIKDGRGLENLLKQI